MEPFISRERDLTVHDTGFVRLPSGIEITRLPIYDMSAGLMARIGPGPLDAWARKRGWRIAHPNTYVELHGVAHHVDPYTLPTAQMIRDAGISRPYDDKGRDTPEMRAYRASNMRGEAWCRQHDLEMWKRLGVSGWAGEPVANFGKHLGAGGLIIGWWEGLGGRMLQPLSDFHAANLLYTDYATTIHVERDGDSVRDVTGSTEPPASDKPIVPTATKKGDTGERVRWWQQHLVEFFAERGSQALPDYGADGDHGEETEVWTDYWRMCQRHGSHTGIDVSGHQMPSAMDWSQLSQRHSFAICRASYGTKRDGAFLDHVAGARRAGMKVGAYLFFRQQQRWQDQLQAFQAELQIAGFSRGDMLPALDLETNATGYDGPLNPAAHNEGGCKIAEALADSFGGCLIYCSPGHFLELGRPEWLLRHHHWVAHFTSKHAPSWPFSRWCIWQHTGKGRSPGYSGDLDLNRARSLPLIP